MDKHISLSPCPLCGMGLTLDIDEDGGVAILHSLKGEKNCWFPSIVEIGMPIGTTLEEMVEILNRRPIEDELRAELAALKSENANLSKKLTDCGKELRKPHKYDKTCSTCRYLDENRDCVLGIRCVNYALWQGRIL